MAQLPPGISLSIDSTFSTSDRVQVLRIIEYEGPREVVERQLSGSIQGTRLFAKGECRITAITLDQFPQVLEHARRVADPQALMDKTREIGRLEMERDQARAQSADLREELSRIDAELRNAQARLGEAQEALSGADQPILATQEELAQLLPARDLGEK